MPEDEVEIESDEEYEVVPLSPIRKLEKRIARIEKKKGQGIPDDALEILKADKEMIQSLVESNSKLIAKLERVAEHWEELIDMLKRGEERHPEKSGGQNDMDELIEFNKKLIENNKEMIEKMKSLEKKVDDGSRKKVKPSVKLKKRRSREGRPRRKEEDTDLEGEERSWRR